MLVKDGLPTVSSTGPDEWPSLSATEAPSSSGWELAFPSLADIYDLPARKASRLADYYRAHIRSTLASLTAQGRQFGALVIEPTCLGAGGMVFVDPLFQACLIDAVRASADLFSGGKDDAAYEADLAAERDSDQWCGLPVIYDEGELTARNTAG